MPTPLLRLLVDNWPDPVVVLNQQGHIVFASKRAEQILGYGAGQLNDGQIAHQRLCANAIRGESHSEADCPLIGRVDDNWRSYWWQKADGQYLSVDIRTQSLEFDPPDALIVCSFIDNSERMHNQTELEKFACLIQLNPTALAEFDRFGQLIFANEAMQSLMIDAGFGEDGLCQLLPHHIHELASKLLSEQPDAQGHCEQVQAGDMVYEWRLMPFSVPDGDPTLLGCVFDVTREIQYRAAVEAAKVAARKEFYAKVVHELRTPLNAILGFSSLLLKRASQKLSEREQQHLEAINRAGFQLSEWVTDSLDAAKIEAGQMGVTLSHFAVDELVEQFWGQIESLAVAKELSIHKQVAAISITADRQKFRQICINLLSNAIKYTVAGHVDFSVTCEGEQLVICVQDTGPGFTDEQKGMLFQSYSMINDEVREGIQGTGLGLVFVRELVAMHHGSIELVSKAGEGAAFYVYLPLVPRAAD